MIQLDCFKTLPQNIIFQLPPTKVFENVSMEIRSASKYFSTLNIHIKKQCVSWCVL